MEKGKGQLSLRIVKFRLSDAEGSSGTSNVAFTCVQVD